MASLSHHLFPSLLFVIFIFSTAINGSLFAQSPTNVCPPFDCGNGGGVMITYPFWNQTEKKTHEHCGYHGLNLSCNGQNQPVLNLSNHLFHVKTINYSQNSLALSYPDDQITRARDSCPKPHNLTLTDIFSSKFFNSTLYNKTLRFFYNCSLFPPSLPDITCLRSGSKRSYVFWDAKVPEFDWNGYCETFSTLPVNENAVDFDGDGEVLVSRAFSEGFKLMWRTPIGACQACEASNGFCGYSNGTDESFFCICPDGRYSFHCRDTGSVAVTVNPNYFHIGEMVLGGLLIVAAVAFYFARKNRLALYRSISRK